MRNDRAGDDPTLREYVAEQFANHRREHQQHEIAHARDHAGTERAIGKAEDAMEKRLSGMNEFRDQLRDQAVTFVRRETVDAWQTEMARMHEQLETAIERRYEELRSLLATEREERRANEALHSADHRGSEGVTRGMSRTTTIIVAAIGVVSTMLGIVIVLSNVLTAKP